MRSAPDSTSDGHRPARQGSTPGMDTLADLASMQLHQQTTRANAGGLRSTEIYDSQGSATPAVLSGVHGVHGPLPARGSLDHTMVEAPSRTAPTRTFTTKALSEAELQTVAHLITYLATNQFAYESHVQLIDLLHRGFRSHIQYNSRSTTEGDPRNYELLADLRSARESMDARFAVGERIWVDWIEDEEMLATTFDECIAVMELCQKAVQEEPGSTRLWSLNARWTTSLYVAATGDSSVQEVVQPSHDIQTWSDEDRMVAGEVCNWQQMIDVWDRGVRATKWRMDKSHLLWDPYTELLLLRLESSPSPDGILQLKAHFLERLQTPHATWDSTFQMFSNFTSRYENQSYEDIMATVNQQCSTTKTIYQARELLELAVKRADESNSSDALLSTFSDYINREMGQNRKKHAFVFEIVDTLYQRALLSFPANTELWEGYFMFLTEEVVSHSRSDVELLSVLDRSTRHCPWSGSLWSQYLLAAERQRMPFPDIGQIKHKATSTGLIDAGGLEDVVQVYVAWCSILRRRAFQEESTDEELDVAEVGMLSAMEDMQRLGEAKYGKAYPGDSSYRLKRIYIKYLTQSGNWHKARETWKQLTESCGDSFEFWLSYYGWELITWGKISYSENTINAPKSPRPSEATKVLLEGLKQPRLDWPEKLIQMLQKHLEDHEDAAEIQRASVQLWKAKQAVKKRREKEAIEAYEAAQAQTMQQAHYLQPETSADSAVSFGTSKRKRDDQNNETDGKGASKRIRGADDEEGVEAQGMPPVMSSELKRDRENSTIIVKNLPRDTTETRLRQYFRDCGTINGLILAVEEPSETATATIEFQSRDDTLTAQTKDKKEFDGREIEVQVGSGTTLFVTNFPAKADESWIKEKFEQFGEIIDVRFPSLKYNTHRRFCYVQFRTAEQAKKATELDGQLVGSTLKLVAKISDPNHRQDRSGALHEGREIHIRNLDREVKESELKAVFSVYGTVQQARIPRDAAGKSKGFGFVVFSTKDEANAALDMSGKNVGNRQVTVSIATKGPAKRLATTIIQSGSRSSISPTPEIKMAYGDDTTTASPGPSVIQDAKPSSAEIQARTVALLNVPDTVNDARIRALAEPYGPLVKVVLRPDHQGAILEFQDVADAGKAALGIEGFEIAPGRKLGVGTVAEMRRQQAEKKNDKLGRNVEQKRKPPAVLQSSVAIRRPGIGGGRGGLGVKRGGLGSSPGVRRQETNKEGTGTDPDGTSKAEKGEGRSNADFKDMFLGKREKS